MQERIFIKNKKGLRISAIVHKPEKNGKFPTIVLLHGFTGYKDEGHIESLAKELEKNDFVAVRFDCSGFGESEGTLEEDYRLSNFYSDTEAVFEHIKSLNYVDIEKFGVWGNSLGGTLAIVFAANNPSVKAISTVSVPTQFARKDNFERRTKAWKEAGYFEKESSRYGHLKIPYDFVTDSEKWNALDCIKEVTKPILFIVGSADENVIPSNTKEIYDLANEPKQFIEIPGMNHFYKKVPQHLHQVDKHIVAFFRGNL